MAACLEMKKEKDKKKENNNKIKRASEFERTLLLQEKRARTQRERTLIEKKITLCSLDKR